jgi:hypothetical protein
MEFARCILFVSHLAIVLVIPAGLFVTNDQITNVHAYHFYYCLVLFISLFLWGGAWSMIYQQPYRRLCVLSSITGLTRGYVLNDPRNFDQTFFGEIAELLLLPKKSVVVMESLIMLSIVASAIRFAGA